MRIEPERLTLACKKRKTNVKKNMNRQIVVWRAAVTVFCTICQSVQSVSTLLLRVKEWFNQIKTDEKCVAKNQFRNPFWAVDSFVLCWSAAMTSLVDDDEAVV